MLTVRVGGPARPGRAGFDDYAQPGLPATFAEGLGARSRAPDFGHGRLTWLGNFSYFARKTLSVDEGRHDRIHEN
jgi:hypothetical protein